MAILTGSNIAFNLDYRSKVDDAWYTSAVILDSGNRLRVKIKDFMESCYDEVFSISDFSNHDDIDKFVRRFRPVSLPIEDNECSKVIEGMTVCATYKGLDGSVRYFDAIVDAVHYKQHTAEKCVCNYVLCWQHGPEEGNITATTLDDICTITTGAVDPKLAEFTKLVKEKLKVASSEFNLIPKSLFLSKRTSSNEISNKSQEFGSAGHSCNVGFSEGDHDTDMGGIKETGCHHYLILENLEKDLCPTLMMQFIHEHTSITAQSYIFPSLLVETYARGAIVVDNISNLKRIYEFISNPNHFIVSFSGRPWVIAEDTLRNGSFNTNLQNLHPRFKNVYTGNELKVVRLETEEYKKAKQQKDLFMEFRNHLNGLFQRLETEEKKNRHPFSAN